MNFMTQGAAGRILNPANSREIRVYIETASTSAKAKGNSASLMKKQKCLVATTAGDLNAKKFGLDSISLVRKNR